MNRICVAALIAALWSGSALASIAAQSESAGNTAIRSTEELTRFLAQTANKGSALDAMPVGARKRFLAQLRFGAGGVGGFGTADLEDTLTQAQIIEVTALFGLQKYGDQLQGLATVRKPRDFESSFELRFNAFNAALELKSTPRASGIETSYRQLLGGSEPVALAQALDAYDRALLLRAMLGVLREDAVPEQAEQCRQVLALLRRYGEETPNQVSQLFDILVTLRQFDLADHVALEYTGAGLSKVPERAFVGDVKAGLNATLQVSADGRRLSRGTLDLTHGLHIVVVAGCHFAKDAATAISAEPELNRLFEQHAVWLAPASERIADVADWNRQLPSQPIQIAWRERDWPQIPSWNMPTFYVFRDGALLNQWSGWPADSGMADLLKGLHDAGVQF